MQPKRFSISPEKLSELYWGQGLKLLEIGKILGYSERTIQIRMHECSIPLRRSGKPAAEITKEELAKLYIEQGLSSRTIAKMYGCSYSYIDSKIRKFGFPIKTRSAAHVTTYRASFSGTL